MSPMIFLLLLTLRLTTTGTSAWRHCTGISFCSINLNLCLPFWSVYIYIYIYIPLILFPNRSLCLIFPISHPKNFLLVDYLLWRFVHRFSLVTTSSWEIPWLKCICAHYLILTSQTWNDRYPNWFNRKNVLCFYEGIDFYYLYSLWLFIFIHAPMQDFFTAGLFLAYQGNLTLKNGDTINWLITL